MLNCSKENRESTKIKIPKMRWDIHCQNLDIRPIHKACTLFENRQESLYWIAGSSKISASVGKFWIMLARINTILTPQRQNSERNLTLIKIFKNA